MSRVIKATPGQIDPSTRDSCIGRCRRTASALNNGEVNGAPAFSMDREAFGPGALLGVPAILIYLQYYGFSASWRDSVANAISGRATSCESAN